MTCGRLEHGDLTQISPRNEPWTAIRNHDFISKVDLMMPLEKFLAMPPQVIRHRQQPAYYRINETSLGQLLQNEKLFNLLQNEEATLFSQRHKSATHTQFNVNKGTLTVQMDKPTFEASGLSGSAGLNEDQHMWTMDLGHDVNVLEYNAEMQLYQGITSPPPALDIGSSFSKDGSPRETQQIGLHVYEWLSLLRLESPRVQSGDSIDTFLSRYKVASNEHSEHEHTGVCKISWVGLIGATWFQTLVRDLLAAHPAEGWLSVSSNSFHDVSLSGNGSELVILRPSAKENQYIMWTLNDSA
ncbi:hypothetical protein E4U55_003954 [Claviceps digitariae]|nr:hypothetical protein E4U55_003954 [Claviceps digitariae]